jgi:hypothetical protein
MPAALTHLELMTKLGWSNDVDLHQGYLLLIVDSGVKAEQLFLTLSLEFLLFLV